MNNFWTPLFAKNFHVVFVTFSRGFCHFCLKNPLLEKVFFMPEKRKEKR